MFNLLVNVGGWFAPRGEMIANRVFEGTEESTKARLLGADGCPDFHQMLLHPVLFVEELNKDSHRQFARVGSISRIQPRGRNYEFQFAFDASIPPITNSKLVEVALEFGIQSAELYRTHWAVKDEDLFRTLLRHNQPARSKPRVFTINDPEVIEDKLVAVMMPFDASFTGVYSAIQDAVTEVGLRCRRADEIWENPAIIQDIVNLIDRAKVVVCDCSGRNANVFYEIGIAHALGREVVLLTQSSSDVPFDLRHLRYISYLNNGEGLQNLVLKLSARLSDLTGA